MAKDIRPIRPGGATFYKLTDQHMRTYGGYQWAPGEPRETSGTGALCGPGWLHVYAHPTLAVLLNPIHVAFKAPRLFEGRCEGVYRSDGLKAGVSRLTLTQELPVPVIPTLSRVAWGIIVSQGVVPQSQATWHTWAERWLDGQDRTMSSAWAAESSARAAMSSARAAESSAWAAESAAWAAKLAAKSAAESAARAAKLAAESAAESAATKDRPFSLMATLNNLAQWEAAEAKRAAGKEQS